MRLTAGRVAAFTCPAGSAQRFLWDTDTPTLALRVTPTGRKTFVFEARLKGATIRKPIGTAADWPIGKARSEAQRLKMLVDAGTDPRQLEREQDAAKVVERVQAAAQRSAETLTVSEAWSAYLVERRPHWGALHYADHVRLSKAGGETCSRGARGGRTVTVAGPLHPLLALRLRDLNAATVEAWAAREGKSRPTAARLSWRLLKAFLGWCAEQPQYAALLPASNPAKTKRSREALGRAGVKTDALLREQLPGWFAAVLKMQNPVTAAYLQTLLLLGARPGEVLELRWEDVNTKWRGLTIRDKVEGERVVPFTPYVWHLLTRLPRRSEFVFSAPKTGKPMSKPHKAHATACKVAGVDGLTLHGLRRSFKSLTEWLEVPAGVVAQLMGHKPSATAEKHYTVRPLDLLRVHHERIEAWILEQAGIEFTPSMSAATLRSMS